MHTGLKWTRRMLLGLLMGLTLGAGAVRAEPVRVVASFSILADFVAQVGGEHVTVSALVGSDQDAHVFQPRPSDAAALAQAQLVVINGLGFEGWITRLLQAAAYQGQVTVASQGVLARSQTQAPELETHQHHHGSGSAHRHPATAPDPHAWHDPRNAVVYVENIAQALAAIDPPRADVYRQRASRYIAQVQALDAWMAEQIATVPAARRVVITSHHSLAYYGARYGVRFLAVQGLSTASEPSARAVAQLIRQARAARATALFFEGIANPVLLRQIASESGAAVGGVLYSDALTSAQGPAPHYLDMMRYNTTTLTRAMRGDSADTPDKATP